MITLTPIGSSTGIFLSTNSGGFALLEGLQLGTSYIVSEDNLDSKFDYYEVVDQFDNPNNQVDS